MGFSGRNNIGLSTIHSLHRGIFTPNRGFPTQGRGNLDSYINRYRKYLSENSGEEKHINPLENNVASIESEMSLGNNMWFDATNFDAAKENSRICRQRLAPGLGSGHHPRWYYDGKTQLCMKFFFTGFLGNENNFLTESECYSTCMNQESDEILESAEEAEIEEHVPVEIPDSARVFRQVTYEYGPKDFFNKNVCSDDTPNTMCSMLQVIERFYFDRYWGKCIPIFWGGCSNECAEGCNFFNSLESCQFYCED